MNLKSLLALPILAFVLLIQMTIASRITLLSGAADLMLLMLAAWALQQQVPSVWEWGLTAGLMVSAVSGVPFVVPIIGYLLVVAIARLVLRRVWEIPFLSMFIVVFTGTLALHFLTYIVLKLSGNPMTFDESFSLITLPTVILNMLLAIPIYTLVRDLALWIFPVEERA